MGCFSPFGMLMPERHGYKVDGGWASGGDNVNGTNFPQNLTINSRTINGEPVEYKASQSIEFVDGFESSNVDEFLAFIADGSSYAGGTTSGSGGESNSYRYGFNGKENDDEIKGVGNQQDYGMRIYDPRLGKFLSVDPLTSEFPELTPYQFSSNSPIAHIDLDGEEQLHFTLAFNNGGKPQLDLIDERVTYKDGWTGRTNKYPLTYLVDFNGHTYTFNQFGGRYGNESNSIEYLETWIYASNKDVKVPGFNELFYSDPELQVDLIADGFTELAEGYAMSKSISPKAGSGTIYEVPGQYTNSGLPYMGRHNQPSPNQTRASTDGRPRSQAKVVDSYNTKDPLEGQYKEQKHIDLRGGVSRLDNKRNEVSRFRMERLEKIYGSKNQIVLPRTKREKASLKESDEKRRQQKADDMIKYHF